MKLKISFAVLLSALLSIFLSAGTAQAAERQQGYRDSFILESPELAEIAELAGTIDLNAQTVDEAPEEEKVKWNDNFNKTDLMFLSCIIYCEAGGMSRDAKLGVANVILNRMRNKGDWAHVNTVKKVIYDNKWGTQFSPTVNGSLSKALQIYKNLGEYEGTWRFDYMLNCIEAAKAAFCGEKSIPDSFLYFNGYIDSSVKKCKKAGKSYLIIEGHIYF